MSSKQAEPLDLDKDLPTTPEDVEALKRIRESRRLPFQEYLEWLSRLELPAEAAGRRRTHSGCAPFEL
jgi:hypothetical protein